MSYSSFFVHPPETRYLKVTDDFYAVCFDAPDASCAAAILNLFVYWTDYRMNALRESVEKGESKPEKIEDVLWFWRNESSIQNDLFNIWGVTKLRANRKWLKAVGFIEETVQEHDSGRQNVYRLNIGFLQFAVQEAWGGAVNSTDGYVIFNGWDALNSPTKKNSSKKKKETTTPLPPEKIEVAAKTETDEKPKEPTELKAMKLAVRALKAYGDTGDRVAKTLLNQHEDDDKNVGGDSFKPDDVPKFIAWWEAKYPDLTIPRNSQSCVKWFNIWRDERQPAKPKVQEVIQLGETLTNQQELYKQIMALPVANHKRTG